MSWLDRILIIIGEGQRANARQLLDFAIEGIAIGVALPVCLLAIAILGDLS